MLSAGVEEYDQQDDQGKSGEISAKDNQWEGCALQW